MLVIIFKIYYNIEQKKPDCQATIENHVRSSGSRSDLRLNKGTYHRATAAPAGGRVHAPTRRARYKNSASSSYTLIVTTWLFTCVSSTIHKHTVLRRVVLISLRPNRSLKYHEWTTAKFPESITQWRPDQFVFCRCFSLSRGGWMGCPP